MFDVSETHTPTGAFSARPALNFTGGNRQFCTEYPLCGVCTTQCTRYRNCFDYADLKRSADSGRWPLQRSAMMKAVTLAMSVAFALSGNGNGHNLGASSEMWSWLGHGDENSETVKRLLDGAPDGHEEPSVAVVESDVESSILNAGSSDSSVAGGNDGAGDAPGKPSDFATRKNGPGGMIAIPLDSQFLQSKKKLA
jgi:hypothetical protein